LLNAAFAIAILYLIPRVCLASLVTRLPRQLKFNVCLRVRRCKENCNFVQTHERKRPLRKPKYGLWDDAKSHLYTPGRRICLYLSGSQITKPREHNNGSLDTMKWCEFLDQMNDCELIHKYLAAYASMWMLHRLPNLRST
jgi:hypothetical protein